MDTMIMWGGYAAAVIVAGGAVVMLKKKATVTVMILNGRKNFSENFPCLKRVKCS